MDFTSINKKGDEVNIHWYLTVADAATGGGKKHEIYVAALVAIFFMTYFYRAGWGGMA